MQSRQRVMMGTVEFTQLIHDPGKVLFSKQRCQSPLFGRPKHCYDLRWLECPVKILLRYMVEAGKDKLIRPGQRAVDVENHTGNTWNHRSEFFKPVER